MSHFVPYQSYSKIGKSLDMLGLLHIPKENWYFQIELCAITPKILLPNLGEVKISPTFDMFEINN